MIRTIAHEYVRVSFLQSHKKLCTIAHENERGLKTHSKKAMNAVRGAENGTNPLKNR